MLHFTAFPARHFVTHRLALPALCVWLLCAPSVAQGEATYFGVYMRAAKIGALVVQQTNQPHAGAPAIRSEATMTLDLRVLGAPSKIVNTTVSWNDPGGKPLALDYSTETAGRRTHITAAYQADAVTYKADIAGEIKEGTLRLKPGEKFLADPAEGSAMKPKVGMRLAGKIFSPETLTLMDGEILVVAREPVAVGGVSVDAFKVQSKNTLASSTLWLSERGELLRLDSVLGMQVRREPKQQALAEPAQKVDLGTVLGIVPQGAALLRPRTLRRAQYILTGLTKPLPLVNNNVQTVEQEPGSPRKDAVLRARITVTTAPLPPGATAPVFGPSQPVPAHLQPFLRSTTYVPADDDQFRQLARTILGNETDTAKAAGKIAAWVSKTMVPDPSIAALRTAKDIVKTPRGVCRDYTTLFATIARAGGIPTKQCVGVAYADGRFLYHAWPEVWVGNNTWVALEPTWGRPFADATHIKLAEGEITDVLSLAQDVGNYRIEVLSAR